MYVTNRNTYVVINKSRRTLSSNINMYKIIAKREMFLRTRNIYAYTLENISKYRWCLRERERERERTRERDLTGRFSSTLTLYHRTLCSSYIICFNINMLLGQTQIWMLHTSNTLFMKSLHAMYFQSCMCYDSGQVHKVLKQFYEN